MITRRDSFRRSRSAGFTLVELLVVFAVIAILAALTVTAVFKVIGVQQANNTQLTIKTVSSLLDKHWATVIKDHQNDVIPINVMTMAGNDPRRARVIWIKLNLKREFPMNLTEALAPWSLAPDIPTGLLTAADLPAKPAYGPAILRAQQITGASFTPNTNKLSATPSQPIVWPFESAFTLVMSLQQNRGGIAFAEENFAANALSSEIFLWGGSPVQILQPPTLPAILTGPKMLVDAWGVPLAFYRWPTGNFDFQPGTTNSPISSTVRNSNFPDPLDPEGTLLDPRWNNATNWTSLGGVFWFEKYCHSVHTGNSPATYKPSALYTEPVIVSAGPDHLLGVQPVGTLHTLAEVPTQKTAQPSLPDEMIVSGTTTDNAWFDNIASYKLRTGGTGDK